MAPHLGGTAIRTRFALPLLLLILGGLAMLDHIGIDLAYSLDPGRIRPDQGNAFAADLRAPWPLEIRADSLVGVLEDGRPLGPPHVARDVTATRGGGAYSQSPEAIHFSTSDNSDPRTNGRSYTAAIRVHVAPEIFLVPLFGIGLLLLRYLSRGLRSGRLRVRDAAWPAGLGGGAALFWLAGLRTEGASFWLCLGAAATLLCWAVARALRARALIAGRRRGSPRWATNASLAIVSSCAALVAGELFLEFRERRAVEPQAATPVAEAGEESRAADLALALESFGVALDRQILNRAVLRQRLMTLPSWMEYRLIEVPGATWAVRWHGVPQVYDRHNMRRTKPLPGRTAGRFRIVVLGDSLTYGAGIAEGATYPRRLEELLRSSYRPEVLNLGIGGYNSEDILRVAQQFLPVLQPDLIVYGVCHNDFLPSYTGQSSSNDAYAIPLPDAMKSFFTHRSRVVRALGKAYDKIFLALGLRLDFFDEILLGLTDYRVRFASDVEQLNALATVQGLPPVVALVLDQYPAIGSRGHRIAQLAEQLLAAGGLDVVDTSGYYLQFDGTRFHVSPFEGHPNEVANAIWATMLARHLLNRGYLEDARSGAD